MKKITALLILLFFIMGIVSCGEDTTTIESTASTTVTTEATTQSSTVSTTTEEGITTTTEPTFIPDDDNEEILLELMTRMNTFDAGVPSVGVMIRNMTMEMSIYMGNQDPDNEIMTELSTATIYYGLAEPWIYIENQSDLSGNGMEMIEFDNGKIIWTSGYGGYVEAEVMETGADLDDFYDTADLLVGSTTVEFPADASYTRLDQDRYLITMTYLQYMMMDGGETLGEMGMDEMFDNMDFNQDVTMEIGFNDEMNLMALSIRIDSFMIDIESQMIMNIYLDETLYYDADAQKPSIPYQYEMMGADYVSQAYLTMYPGRDYQLFVPADSSNFYKLYLEEGFYVIDDERALYGDIQLLLYDSDYIRVNGNHVFAIEEDGYYYINYLNQSEANFHIDPTIYQLSPELVGIPSNPILTTDNPLDVDAEESMTYLFEAEVDSKGFFIIHDTTSDTSGYRPQYGLSCSTISFEDTYWETGDYYLFMVYPGNTIAMEFMKDSIGSDSYEWEYYTQPDITWNLLSMPEISFAEPTILLFTKNESAVNYQFTVSETKTVTFNYERWYSPCLYADALINLYDSTGTMIGNNIIGDEITLEPGDYYLNINVSGISNTDSDYIIVDLFIFFVLEMNESE